MAIVVTCPGCHTRFKVSEKFAGREGPCPKCKKSIRVPSKEDEVTIHAPEEFEGGGRDTKGRLVLKPIERADRKITPLRIGIVAAAALGLLVMAWAGSSLIRESAALRALGLAIVSPVLAYAGYEVLKSEDREAIEGRELLIRSAICGVAFAATWGGYAMLPESLTLDSWNALYIAIPFVLFGSLVSLGSFDFDFGTGFFHYAFYVLATMLLRWAIGMAPIWAA